MTSQIQERGSSVTDRQRKTGRMNEDLSRDLAVYEQSDNSSLIEPYRKELLLHCYRLLGSLHDAEDVVQETMLRAWRHFDTFRRFSIVAHLAVHDCDQCQPRYPQETPAAHAADRSLSRVGPERPIAPRNAEALWLEPFPDMAGMARATENPEARYTRSESISLAFLTALQLLPPRQRAILILSDVLDWRASRDRASA